MARRAKKLSGEDTDLRRWCIEQACAWPTARWYPNQGMAGLQQGAFYAAPAQVEPDVIARAKRILDWVNGTS